MSRALSITEAEWPARSDGTLWVVMPGESCHSRESCHSTRCAWSGPPPWPDHDCRCRGRVQPPWPLVSAALPCETCRGGRSVLLSDGDVFSKTPNNCPDCRVELVGECPTCSTEPTIGCPTWHPGTVHLGYAYAVSGVLPILLSGGCPEQVEHLCVTVLGTVLHHLPLSDSLDTEFTVPTDAILRGGDPSTLVDQYALRLRVVA